MTNMLGNKLVIFDTDALVGLVNDNDSLHERCLKVIENLKINSYDAVIPYPIVLEAATVLAKDKQILRADLAKIVLEKYAAVEVPMEFVTEVGDLVAEIYNSKTSKKNSPFDHYVLALAKKNGINYVFSFDGFYKKNGLKLANEI